MSYAQATQGNINKWTVYTQKIVFPPHKTQTTSPDSKNLSRNKLSKLTTCCHYAHSSWTNSYAQKQNKTNANSSVERQRSSSAQIWARTILKTTANRRDAHIRNPLHRQIWNMEWRNIETLIRHNYYRIY